jgi:hypothetical protein
MSIENNIERQVENKSSLDVMEKVFSNLSILEVGALRTHRIWDREAKAFSSENVETFLNNLPGLIAVFKATERKLMKEGIFTPAQAQDKIPGILTDMINQEFPSAEEIIGNPNALPDCLSKSDNLCDEIILANATWATRATSRNEADGTRLKRVGRVNSMIKLVSSALLPGEDSDEKRVKRHMDVVKDYDQIRVGAQWWLDVLTDPSKLAGELAEISSIKNL